MNPMPRESGKRFPIVAATAIACAAWFIFVSNATAAPQFPLAQGAAAPSNTSTYHATSGPDLVSLSRCAELVPLMGPSGKARSVTEFGAVPDDGRDATAAIQRALDAMKPGEWLVFPPGRYVHSTRLRVQVPGVKLWGRGAHLHATNPADMAVMLMADGGEVLMFAAGDRLVLSLWDRAAFEAEVGGPALEGDGLVPMTLAHNVATPAEVRGVLDRARGAGAQVWGPAEREWGGFTGYFADPDGFRWEVAWNPGPIGLRVVPDTDVDARP